jgi:hypothetical protein
MLSANKKLLPNFSALTMRVFLGWIAAMLSANKKLLLCGLALISLLLLTPAFIISHGQHDCPGHDCPVCAQVSLLQNTSKQPALAAMASPWAAAALWLIPALGPALSRRRHGRTLVALKIRMNK